MGLKSSGLLLRSSCLSVNCNDYRGREDTYMQLCKSRQSFGAIPFAWCFLFLKIYFCLTCISVFACMRVCVRVSGPPELALQTAVGRHVGAGN